MVPKAPHEPARRDAFPARAYAGFNRWCPAMEGKRTQGVIHKYLLEAAEDIETKGVRLSERLYVPQHLSEARKSDIAARRRAKLAFLQSLEDDVQFRMALVLGEADRGVLPGPLLQSLRSIGGREPDIEVIKNRRPDDVARHSTRLVVADRCLA